MGRKIDAILNNHAGGNTGPVSLSAKLLAQHDARHAQREKAAAPKFSLTTTRQKQDLLKETITGHMTSAIQLLKMRARAAKELHKKDNFLGEHARDFLHRSAGGKKLESSAAIEKLVEEGIEAEIEQTQDDVHSPVDYKLRQESESHRKFSAKKIVRDYRKEQEREAQKHAPHEDDLAKRKEALSALHARLTAQAPTSAPAVSRPSTPTMTFMQPMPLPTTGTGSGHPLTPHYSSPLHSQPSAPALGHIEPVAPVSTDQATPSIADNTDTPVDPAPVEPTAPEPHIGDAFGGSGEDDE